MKKISCGVLIVKNENGNKSLFMAHVTNKIFWDIPKGGISLNESFIETAIREMIEEVGFKCSKEDLLDLGFFKYTERKDLYLFKYIGNKEFKVENAVCTSNFFSKLYQMHLPEVDDFKYVPFNEIINYCSEGFKNVLPILLRDNII
jgi:8-oxo-dGTP pyrophosphatase MutT (NUDIX family)